MANYGKRPINDAGQAERVRAAVAMLVETKEGVESRLDRRPYGKCERFVDPVGNVITLQMSTPGDPRAVETALRTRNQKHADGWVEHAKCPLRHGINNLTPALEREFKKLPANLKQPCAGDPKVMSRKDGELYAEKSCDHIEWLIASRTKAEAAANAKRNEARAKEELRLKEAAELQAIQLEEAREKLAERKRKAPAKSKDGVE